MATFTAELATGFVVLGNGRNSAALDVLSNVVVASLLIGVARAWELVGDRDTGIISSIAALAGRDRPLTGYGAGRPPPDDCAQPATLARRERHVYAEQPSVRAVNSGRRRVVLPANTRGQAGRATVMVSQKKQVDRNGTLDPVLNQGNLVN